METITRSKDIVASKLAEMNLKQVELSRKTGIPAATLSMYLSGQRNPNHLILEKCSSELSLDMNELMEADRQYEEWAKSSEGKKQLSLEKRKSDAAPAGMLANWQILLHINLDDIQISNFDQSKLRLASLDLTRGKFVKISESSKRFSEDHELDLKPGETCIVYAREILQLPSFIAAKAGGKAFHIESGISVSFGLQFDPEYIGRPFAQLTNNGSETMPIPPGDEFLSIEFHYLSNPPDHDLM